MQSLTTEGLFRGLGICVLTLGLYIVTNIAILTHIYVNYYGILEQALANEVGLVWLRLVFEPLSGAMIGTTLAVIGIGMLRLRNWARVIALALMGINFFVLGCWIFLTRFDYIDQTQLMQVLIMYSLIVLLLNLKGIKASFS